MNFSLTNAEYKIFEFAPQPWPAQFELYISLKPTPGTSDEKPAATIQFSLKSGR
jgi:hypothetical protein